LGSCLDREKRGEKRGAAETDHRLVSRVGFEGKDLDRNKVRNPGVITKVEKHPINRPVPTNSDIVQCLEGRNNMSRLALGL